MGDVYEAMNRSKRERGQKADDSADQANPAPVIPETPADLDPREDSESALPLEEVDAVALVNEPDADVAPDAAVASAAPAPQPEPPQDEPEPEPAPAAATTLDDMAPPVSAESVARARPERMLSSTDYAQDMIVHHDRGSIIADQYRAVRLQVLSRARTRRVQTHVITSSAPQEGKTVTTINLGMAFGELDNTRTCMLECDLRRPTFQKQLRDGDGPGVVQLLNRELADLDDVIRPTSLPNLDYIPAGGRATNSAELLSTDRMKNLLALLCQRYDHILIDSPPAIQVTDACILGAMADDVLLVVRLNKTPSDVVDRAKRLLRASHCDLAGVVLTHQRFHVPNYLYQYQYS